MPEDKSKVEEMDDNLYSRTRYKNPLDKRSAVKPLETPDTVEKWQGPELNEILAHERVSPPINPMMKKFFVFAVLFFIAALFVAGFVFLGGSNFISSKNVDITVVGPTTASAGEVVELGVTIKNQNNTDLELANFSVQYPQGTRDPADSSKTLTYTKYDLGVVKAGDEVARNVRMVLIGTTGEVKEVKLSVEYKVKGSNATFHKDKIYEVTIGSSPMTIKVDSPPSVSSGDTFVTTVTVTLNSTEVLRNVMLRAEYPYGYSVESATPEALAEDNVWSLGDLSPGSTKKIVIRGRLVGENQDERTFRFYAGVADGDTASPSFKTVILSAQETIAIERPSISLSVGFNGENVPTYIAPAGQSVSTTVRFQNNLAESLLNPHLEVRLAGNTLNKATIIAQNNGVYNSGTNRINWTLFNTQSLAMFAPGEKGDVSFLFASLPDVTAVGGSRDITLQFILTGTLVSGSVPVTVSETRTVRIGSQVNLSSKAVHSLGPFSNIGPIPPKVSKETTYAVMWSIGNTYNDLSNAKITARLGTGVKWVGAQSVGSENISYDAPTNTVTWDLGGVASGLGFSSPAREAAFQISLTPTSGQVGSAPVLANSIVFTAYDTVTGKNVTVSSPALNTRISSDPAFIQGDDIVIKK